MIFVIILSVFLIADQTMKCAIESMPQEDFPKMVEHTSGNVEFERVHNFGLPFGVFKQFGNAIKTVTLAVTGFFLAVFSVLLLKNDRRPEKAGLAVLLAGAVSNLMDRFFRGYVVDYIHIKKKPADRTVFNLADVFIAIGALILATVTFIRDLTKKGV